MLCSCITFCFIKSKEMLWSAWTVPMISPLSCSGKKPFGTTTNSTTLSTMVSRNPMPTSRACASAQRSVRS